MEPLGWELNLFHFQFFPKLVGILEMPWRHHEDAQETEWRHPGDIGVNCLAQVYRTEAVDQLLRDIAQVSDL